MEHNLTNFVCDEGFITGRKAMHLTKLVGEACLITRSICHCCGKSVYTRCMAVSMPYFFPIPDGEQGGQDAQSNTKP